MDAHQLFNVHPLESLTGAEPSPIVSCHAEPFSKVEQTIDNPLSFNLGSISSDHSQS